MQLIEAFRLAFQALWANKLRSILTLIGVVMGVASVIMVITLVQGADHYVATKLTNYGADVFSIRRGGIVFDAETYLKFQKRKLIRMEDYEAVREHCSSCQDVGAQLTRNVSVVANGHSTTDTTLRGYTWTMLGLTNIEIESGRGFTPADAEHATRNVIVGYDIVDNLLGSGDPMGKEIRVDGIPYTIIGVAEPQGKTLGESQDNWVAIPITTYEQTYGHNDSVVIDVRSGGNAQVMALAEDEVRALMRARRHNRPGTEDDFEIQTNDTFLDIWKQISSLFASVVLGLASIALVVGGVVIMNIMLVSVTERTREIGVRKALGAKQRDVLLQFLIESGALALVGGALGVMGGVLVGKIITLVVGFPTAVPFWAILLGLFLATSVGIFFGVYPASKAAKLDPVAALRAEM